MPLRATSLCLSMVIEFVTPVCIVVGWYDRLAAFILAGFCVITAVLFHQFWRFRSSGDSRKARACSTSGNFSRT